MNMPAIVAIGPLKQADNDTRSDFVLSNEFNTKSTYEFLQRQIDLNPRAVSSFLEFVSSVLLVVMSSEREGLEMVS